MNKTGEINNEGFQYGELDWYNSFRCPRCGKLYDGKKCKGCGYVP